MLITQQMDDDLTDQEIENQIASNVPADGAISSKKQNEIKYNPQNSASSASIEAKENSKQIELSETKVAQTSFSLNYK